MIAVRGRRYGVPELDRQVERYVAMAEHYVAAVATVRLHRQREREEAGG